MAEPKHTAGPLTFDPDTLTIGKDGCVLGRTYDRDDFPCLDDEEQARQRDREALANGYLWAAAPRLLAACKKAANHIDPSTNPTDSDAVLAELRAAIAKATAGNTDQERSDSDHV